MVTSSVLISPEECEITLSSITTWLYYIPGRPCNMQIHIMLKALLCT